jgi:hypothetical protein
MIRNNCSQSFTQVPSVLCINLQTCFIHEGKTFHESIEHVRSSKLWFFGSTDEDLIVSVKGKGQVSYKLCAAVYQQSDHLITRFEDENGTPISRMVDNVVVTPVLYVSVLGGLFSSVYMLARKVYIILYYVMQVEQDADG